MNYYNVACAIIENDNGEIFCCKIGHGRPLEGMWEFPGGKIGECEKPQDALKREIKEKLKSEIEVINLLGFSNYKYTEGYDDFLINLIGFKCRLISGNLELAEYAESKWVNKCDLFNISNDFIEADKPFLKRINVNPLYKVYILENKKKSENVNPNIPSDLWDLAIKLDEEGIPVMSRKFDTFTDFPDRFNEVVSDLLIEKGNGNNYIPIIHISGHGKKTGIALFESVLGNDYDELGVNFFTWEHLKLQLDKINEKLFPDNVYSPIILCMSTCYGINAFECDKYSSNGHHVAHVILGKDDEIRWDFAHRAFEQFYLSLFTSEKSIDDSVIEMNKVIDNPNYFEVKYLY